MPSDNILTDDYVAELLAKDAKESSIRYSTIGLGAFSTTSKPPPNKPRPNTRFLQSIIKETDSHNAALLAKEAAEARLRLRDLPTNNRPKPRVSGGDIRRRQLGDIAAILGAGPSKRRRTEDQRSKDERSLRTRGGREDHEKKASSNTTRHTNRGSKEEARSAQKESENNREDAEGDHRSKSRRDRPRRRSASPDLAKQIEERRRRYRSRSRSPRRSADKESRHRHRSPTRRRGHSPDVEHDRHKSHNSRRHRSSSREHSSKSKNSHRTTSTPPDTKMDEDSDPLDDIIGPRPAPVPEVRTRGRGTISHASGIDARFSTSYDPTTDVQLDGDEENDWDQALEALRDRQKWKQQGADRLRAAGFTDEEVAKWERGGEKREEDVRWAKMGEGREWDRGKVLDGMGEVGREPAFGRLKDD